MTVEVLLSTMDCQDMSIASQMNISSDALIVNQTKDREGSVEENRDGHRFHMISVNERGLSKSRNLAIRNASGDVCLFADDDLKYCDDYEAVIRKAYEDYPDADMIAFYVRSMNDERPVTRQKTKKIGLLYSFKISSVQVTFKRSSVASRGLAFNEAFGAGARYICGEENIFLAKCLRAGLKIIYIDEEIARVYQAGSSWFNGFNESYLFTKGAMFYEISHLLFLPLILQYALRKYKLFSSDLNFFAVLKAMLNGKRDYIVYSKGKG